MTRRILFVDDDKSFRVESAEFFQGRNFAVVLACDGLEGLAALRDSQEPYDAMVLDLRMPKMSGEEMLRQVRQQNLRVPPIIVLSGYFDNRLVSFCLDYGVKCLFGKPCKMAEIEKAVSAIADGDDSKLWSLADQPTSEIKAAFSHGIALFKLTPDLQKIVAARDPIGSMVSAREAALRAFFLDRTNHPVQGGIGAEEPLFLVARRWNSWYPSFFNVPGGCYALISPPQADGHRPCAVIDPGFKCLEVLSQLGISIHDIGAWVVSHNHPDHVAGIFELMASRHALGLKTKCWCNPTTKDMFGDCSDFGLEITELHTSIQGVLFSYQDKSRKVRIVGFPTAHREIGRSSASMGLTVSCSLDDPKGGHVIGKSVILGDTEYDRSQQLQFPDLLTDAGMRFVVLHVGSVQEKQREGGHLYYPGLKRLLTDMDAALERKGWAGDKLPVLLSEWGLEHATRSQIRAICGKDLADFDDRSPMVEIAEQLNRDLHMIHVLPADVGLAIGLETGRIHLPDGSEGPAEKVQPVVTPDGIEYRLDSYTVHQGG